MKKILCVLIMLLGVPAFATTMCADDDIIVVVLDPVIAGMSSTSNATLFEWGVTFSYGAIWGTATCIGTGGGYGVGVDDLRTADGSPAIGGEREGLNCWCQMTHPATSRWVFQYTAATLDDCASFCTSGCAYNISNSDYFRAALFKPGEN